MSKPNVRAASGCVVHRTVNNVLQVLLVTATNNVNDWVLPKGGIEPNMTAQASAAKEVYEEAGVLGTVQNPLGWYRHIKSTGQAQRVMMFSMAYGGDAPDWPEHKKRQRKWVPATDAIFIVSPYLAPFILDVIEMQRQ